VEVTLEYVAAVSDAHRVNDHLPRISHSCRIRFGKFRALAGPSLERRECRRRIDMRETGVAA
jgi:hypothetical protein